MEFPAHLLPAVHAFARVAHYGSFTRAAAELGVSASALSQTLRGLEARLGVRLLNRTTRRVGLIEAGQRLLERVRPALGAIGEALEDLDAARGHPAGTLRINSSRVACGLLIAPHLAEFQARYPGITLELVLDDSLSDLVAGGFDAGIRLGENLARDMVAVRISRNQRMVTAGSPAYFRRHGGPPPASPADLAGHDCIGTRFESRGALYRWEYQRPDGQLLEVDVPHRLVTNDFALMVQAGLDGLGLIHVLEDPILAHLANGALVPVLQDWTATFPGFYLYYPHRAHMALKLRVFIDFLRARLPDAGMPPPGPGEL